MTRECRKTHVVVFERERFITVMAVALLRKARNKVRGKMYIDVHMNTVMSLATQGESLITC